MARMVSRSRRREGRGLGERLSEVAVYIAIIVALVMAGRWYVVVYLRSPNTALSRYIGALKAGDADTQYNLLAKSTKEQFGSQRNYDDKWGPAHGLAARVANFNITKMTESGDKATADVTITIRKTGQELYQAGSDNYQDRYALVKEADGWKVALERSDVKSAAAAPPSR